jgi:hypothetical protein
MWWRWIWGRGWRTPCCSSGWSQRACSMASRSRKGSASPTRWARGPLYHRAALRWRRRLAGGRWCREWPGCRGSPQRPNGCKRWSSSAVNWVCNRVMLALAYDAALRRKEFCSLRSDDLDPAHRTLRVRPRPAGSGWCRTRRRPACCWRSICGTGRRLAGPAGRCSCRSRGAPRRLRAPREQVSLIRRCITWSNDRACIERLRPVVTRIAVARCSH